MAFRNRTLEQMNRQYLYSSDLAIAEQIKNKTGIRSGRCLELFAGSGYLGLALAQISNLEIYLMDASTDMIRLAGKNIADCGLADRVRTLRGGIRGTIALPDESMDLICSKRSVFFWKDRQKIFAEIYRVLAPGGVACIGGGFENQDLRLRVENRLAEYDPGLLNRLNDQVWRQRVAPICQKLTAAGIAGYEVNFSDNEFWILIRKPAAYSNAG
jgi:ubiquinone/menaquinone biosynthesis C-methylase UbiE